MPRGVRSSLFNNHHLHLIPSLVVSSPLVTFNHSRKIAPSHDLGTAPLPAPAASSVWNKGWREVPSKPKDSHPRVPKTKARRAADDVDGAMDNIDAGILSTTRSSRGSTPQGLDGYDNAPRALQGTDNLDIFNSFCTQGHVECVDGYEVGTGVSCEAACEGACCVDPTNNPSFGPCDGFTGRVCKDNISCYGYRACYNAIIPYVFESCGVTDDYDANDYVREESGRKSCDRAGRDGSVGPLVLKSCGGYLSCVYLGRGGSVQNVQDSCQGERSCYVAGEAGGSLGCIIASCNQAKSCRALGYGAAFAIDSSVINCCNAASECEGYGPFGVGPIESAAGLPADCYVSDCTEMTSFCA